MNSKHALWISAFLLVPGGCTSHSGNAVAPGQSPHAEKTDQDREEEGDEMEENEAAEASHVESDEHADLHAESSEQRHHEVGEPSYAPAVRVSFDSAAGGALPRGWKTEGTNQKGPLATWKLVEDASAPSKGQVLALASPNHDSGGTFNLCWTEQTRFKDGAIQVSMKAVSGKEDQGGGLIWRAKDKDNYYICRANPLESNFRVYYVKGGKRTQLATANAKIETGRWHTIRVEQQGEQIACSFDGKKLLSVSDATFPDEGGIGLWTKADAASEFDDLEVAGIEPAKRGK